ncbi:hypothetical protein OMW55_09670 [Sphingomonas sp. BN140010]|uniref:Helix-turn-helix domain-containing protein n=1 Tax=Sphingomonas arvum TaxID=2992113 RepID=A0ABT3JH56_9SPHN|nr:hypothetical protein [Sphingomonas sp. BN140010]MCW3798070.1 hypothetical protein [Sphingomonas sp. BN140010]
MSRLAQRWGVSQDYIVEEIRTRRLVGRRIGGRHLRVHEDEVLRYEREHRLSVQPD